ncbi:MAG: xylose isomerase [Firmicutes bacterium HGW-Firmicutes-7]|nr:MAG: xylose isomerase [Firmicutes bacterium HGW-Firmicutes-7]
MSVITMGNISVMSVQYVHYSFSYYLDSMKRCGLKNIDLWGGTPHYCRLDYLSSSAAEKKIAQMCKEIDDLGMRVEIYTPETLSYPYSFSDPAPAVRKRTIEFFDMAMEDALCFGTNKLFINTGCGLLDLPREESWQRCAESIRKIADIAERKGIILMLEQLQPYESNLLTTLPDMIRMLKDVASHSLQTCVDLVAMEVVGEKLEQYFEALPNNIQHIHYADGDPSGHYILGDGNLPLKEYIKILEKFNYTGSVDLEINDSIYWADPHTSIKRSADYLREFLPEL